MNGIYLMLESCEYNSFKSLHSKEHLERYVGETLLPQGLPGSEISSPCGCVLFVTSPAKSIPLNLFIKI